MNYLLMRATLAACLVLTAAPTLQAQLAPYNPYATDVDEAIPVTPDGKIHWPTFYRSLGLKNRFQFYFETGSCVGTRMAIVDRLNANKLDVDHLAVASIHGKIASVRSGLIAVLEPNGALTNVMLHPAGVTRTKISGTMPAAGLQPGLWVRYQGKVDEHGRGAESIERLDVFTPEPGSSAPAIRPEHLQTIVGQVLQGHGHQLQLRVDGKRLTRVSLLVKDSCVVSLNTHDPRLMFAGDEISVTGHLRQGDGRTVPRTPFADDIAVRKAFQPDQSDQPTTTPNAGADLQQ